MNYGNKEQISLSWVKFVRFCYYSRYNNNFVFLSGYKVIGLNVMLVIVEELEE